MSNFYNQEVKKVIEELNTSDKTGLSAEEVKRRLEKFGPNQLVSKKRKTFIKDRKSVV